VEMDTETGMMQSQARGLLEEVKKYSVTGARCHGGIHGHTRGFLLSEHSQD
jgi:hypothetical protein